MNKVSLIIAGLVIISGTFFIWRTERTKISQPAAVIETIGQKSEQQPDLVNAEKQTAEEIKVTSKNTEQLKTHNSREIPLNLGISSKEVDALSLDNNAIEPAATGVAEKVEQVREEVIKDNTTEETLITICQKKSGDYPQRNKLIFNELAWMGGNNSANDEWIELKNVAGKEIDLTGWQILDNDRQVKIIFDRGLASANDFYLLERTNDDSALGETADLLYTGVLNNNNEALELFDGNCQLQDQVLAEPDWPAGDNSTSSKRTMERKSDLTWQTSLDSGGTPKAENSSGFIEPQPPNQPVDEPTNPSANEPANQPASQPAQNYVLISEVKMAGDGEFVELFNPTDNDINLCQGEDNCWHLSYFSLGRDWNNPYRNKSFSNATNSAMIPAKSYYLLGFGYSNSDWQVYGSTQLSNSDGAVGIFSCNPKNSAENSKTPDEAKSCKIDIIAWGGATTTAEGVPANSAPDGKALARKIIVGSHTYIDSDNNGSDFEVQEPTPKYQNYSSQ